LTAAFNTISSYKKGSGLDLRVDTSQNNMQNYNGNSLNGVVNIPTSPHSFPDAYTMSGNSAYHHQSSHYGQNYESIDPSALTMSPISNDPHGSMPRNIPIPQNGGFGQSYGPNFNGSQNLGYMTTDELISLDLSKNDGMDGYSNGDDQLGGYDMHLVSNHNVALGSGTLDSGYSHTPDHGPGDSPFARPYQNHQFRHMQSFNGATIETPSSYNSQMSRNPIDINGNHKSPHPKSPNTPKTPGLTGLSLNGTDTSSMPIQNHQMGIHRHHKSLPGGQWDGTPGSQLSYMDSPLSSPGTGSAGHTGISEMMKVKHASLPTKVENPGAPTFQTQEAKRRRRRESHNMVERRRRDNINERIQELSHLVPQHRLEDEKVRKHLQNNLPLSPTIAATGASPPRATSMLAGGVGRRASGVTGAGMPGDEKDKGPNKGDILNGAVTWTRDLMWCLHEKYKQEEKLREWAAQNGLQFPIEATEEERRMKSELMASIEKNTSATRKFSYTRGPGSGLRVPGYTDIAGSAITVGTSGLTSPSVSPVYATVPGARNTSSSGSAATSLSRAQSQGGQPQFWPNGDGMTFKEEESFGMDLS
ncbi:hypothetical protein BGX38DRAFT_1084643, partial [Terfezia claveryi]